MKSLVTEGAGFTGSPLVDALIRRGDKVLVIDDLSTGCREHLQPSADFLEESVCSTVAAEAVRAGGGLSRPRPWVRLVDQQEGLLRQ